MPARSRSRHAPSPARSWAGGRPARARPPPRARGRGRRRCRGRRSRRCPARRADADRRARSIGRPGSARAPARRSGARSRQARRAQVGEARGGVLGRRRRVGRQAVLLHRGPAVEVALAQGRRRGRRSPRAPPRAGRTRARRPPPRRTARGRAPDGGGPGRTSLRWRYATRSPWRRQSATGSMPAYAQWPVSMQSGTSRIRREPLDLVLELHVGARVGVEHADQAVVLRGESRQLARRSQRASPTRPRTAAASPPAGRPRPRGPG